jgi:hypothetical protein
MLTGVEPVILASARKHGIADEDMLHAYRNPIRVFDLDDLTLAIGASRAGEPLSRSVSRPPRPSTSSSTPCPHGPRFLR